eukprot:IDg14292t1
MNSDKIADEAASIVRAPAAFSTASRYALPARMYQNILADMNVDPSNADFSATRDRNKDPISAALKLILMRCGAKKDSYEGLSALATGGACKSAVVAFWRSHGHFADYSKHPDGSFSGNPGKSLALQDLINKLEASQRKARTHKATRAYQETHEDVRKICTRYLDPVIERALQKDSSIDYSLLQAAVLNCCLFGSVSRADELLSLHAEDLLRSGDTVDSPVCGVLQISKTRRRTEPILHFRELFIEAFALEKVLVWKAVLRAHGIVSGPIFVTITSNKLYGGRKLSHSAYEDALKQFSLSCGIPPLQEHSARRAGLGYQYFVLKKDLLFLFRSYSWDDLNEMIRYIGLTDTVNALLGFSCLRVNEST